MPDASAVREWLAVCYGSRMGRGYSSSGGRVGGRSYAGYGTTGDYGYRARGNYGESQFGGGSGQRPGGRRARHLTPEEYWQRYFGPASYEGRTRGEDTGDRFVPADTQAGGAETAHRMAGPSRQPHAPPRGTRRSDPQLYEDICEALTQRDDVDSSDVTVAVREGEVTLEGTVPERSMRYLIEDLAAGHPAVRDVDNRIKVRKP